jgi:hypothetical protein
VAMVPMRSPVRREVAGRIQFKVRAENRIN